MLILSEKLRQAAKLSNRMDEISANFSKLPGIDLKGALLGQDIRVPPNVAAEIQEFEQIKLELEKLFHLQPERETTPTMSNDAVSAEAKTLAADLDKAPSGETIIARLLEAQILLQRKNAELEAKLDKVLDQMLLLAKLVDTHELAMEKVGIMRAAREDENPGGIVH